MGSSVSTFYRYRRRYEEEGVEGQAFRTARGVNHSIIQIQLFGDIDGHLHLFHGLLTDSLIGGYDVHAKKWQVGSFSLKGFDKIRDLSEFGFLPFPWIRSMASAYSFQHDFYMVKIEFTA
ncbi:MAG: hypothetical protein JRD68_12630 [Deltaproteobacteria bacterium]|nr:hypothetical protein [Deltaproteobacteria bacterium]